MTSNVTSSPGLQVWWDVVKEAFGFVVVFITHSLLLLCSLAVLGIPGLHLFNCSNSKKRKQKHTHKKNNQYIWVYVPLKSCIIQWYLFQNKNIPTTSFVRSSLNWAFAVSKSKSDSNCKVVAVGFFTRSWPLLLFLDLRLPVQWKKIHQSLTVKRLVQQPLRTGSPGLGYLLSIY